MTEPNDRERELAATCHLGAGSWTEAIATLLARYRAEVTEKVTRRMSPDGNGARRHTNGGLQRAEHGAEYVSCGCSLRGSCAACDPLADSDAGKWRP